MLWIRIAAGSVPVHVCVRACVRACVCVDTAVLVTSYFRTQKLNIHDLLVHDGGSGCFDTLAVVVQVHSFHAPLSLSV